VDALPQLRGLLVVLLVKGQQIGGHVLHGGVIFLSLQGFHVGDLGRTVLLSGREEPHGCTGDGLFIDLA
jgi:hypothetical protein